MKNFFIIIIAIALMIVFAGCSDSKLDITSKDRESIDSIEISSLPASKEFDKTTKDADSIKIIIDYLNSIDLKKTQKKASEYYGMSFLIKINYTDGSTKNFVHFGNTFFKEGDGEFLEMKYEQAEKFEGIVKKIK